MLASPILLGQHRGHRVIRSVAVRHCPRHDRGDAPLDPRHRVRLDVPYRLQDGKHVGRRYRVDALAADCGHGVGFQARLPVRRGLGPPRLRVNLEVGGEGIREGGRVRRRGVKLAAQSAALGPVVKGFLPRRRARRLSNVSSRASRSEPAGSRPGRVRRACRQSRQSGSTAGNRRRGPAGTGVAVAVDARPRRFDFSYCELSRARATASAMSRASQAFKLVGAAGFEPTTTTPPVWCATRLRYAPDGVDCNACRDAGVKSCGGR